MPTTANVSQTYNQTIKRYLLLPALVLSLTVCAPAQRIENGPPAINPQTKPIIGVSIGDFYGDYGFETRQAISRELQLAGFKVFNSYEYQILDKAEIQIEGGAVQAVSLDQTSYERVNQARILVRDLNTNQIQFSIVQDPAQTVLAAPRLKDFVKFVTVEIQKRYSPAN
jgi:hypothetical protein